MDLLFIVQEKEKYRKILFLLKMEFQQAGRSIKKNESVENMRWWYIEEIAISFFTLLLLQRLHYFLWGLFLSSGTVTKVGQVDQGLAVLNKSFKNVK